MIHGSVRPGDLAGGPGIFAVQLLGHGIVGPQGIDQLAAGLAVAADHVGIFAGKAAIQRRCAVRPLRFAQQRRQFGDRRAAAGAIVADLLLPQQQFGIQIAARVDQAADEDLPRLIGPGLRAEILQEPPQGFHAAGFLGFLEPLGNHAIDRGGRPGIGAAHWPNWLCTQRSRRTCVARSDRFQPPVLEVQLDQLLVIVQRLFPLPRLLETVGHQPQEEWPCSWGSSNSRSISAARRDAR